MRPPSSRRIAARRRPPPAACCSISTVRRPIDVPLALARDQKVDLTKISILQLANQYLDFIEQARELRLELAADYLVMAAWLAYLKSRLLLPSTDADGEQLSAAEMAERLALQLQRLEAMRNLGRAMMGRPHQLRFLRAAPEPLDVVNTPVYGCR
jgi:segregation and condensation protein A